MALAKPRDAALEASRLRLRPILMTSFAFILGVTPLLFANGAGAASRRSLGTAVFGGMNAATLLAIFLVPVLFFNTASGIVKFVPCCRLQSVLASWGFSG